MRRSYHNTTGSGGGTLDKYEAKARTQELAVSRWFVMHAGDYTPSEVWGAVFTRMVPLTSVRRAMTNLTNAGVLEKTEKQRAGLYGRPEYAWRLSTSRAQQASLFT
jgi:hypothetical protein